MNVFSKLLLIAVATLGATICVPAIAQDVTVQSSASALIRQGILPIRVKSDNQRLAGQVRAALNMHGAFSVSNPTTSSAMIFVTANADGSLIAKGEGADPAFAGTVFAVGTPDNADAVAKLCDEIIVAVGKKYGWGLKPLFSKTKVAFSSDRSGFKEIWWTDLRFAGKIKPLTNHRSISIAPHWSPDGNRILYTTYRAGPADVYSVNVANGRSSRFATYRNSNTGGEFSPDGSMVALALSAKGPMNIYTKPANGGNAKPVCQDRDVQSCPTFSPDGNTICFASGATGRPCLYTVPANGGKKKRLAGTPNAYSTDPDWSTVSPTKIAFSLRQGGDKIAVYDTAQKKTSVLEIPRKLSNPQWCSDGRHVVAVEEAGRSHWLVLVDTEGNAKPKCTRISPSSMRNCSDPATLVVK